MIQEGSRYREREIPGPVRLPERSNPVDWVAVPNQGPFPSRTRSAIVYVFYATAEYICESYHVLPIKKPFRYIKKSRKPQKHCHISTNIYIVLFFNAIFVTSHF